MLCHHQFGGIFLRSFTCLDRARIAIENSGGGFPDDVLPRSFDRCFTTKPTGTGLSVSIDRNIVTEHGGRIVVETHVGSGTSVQIESPVPANQPA